MEQSRTYFISIPTLLIGVIADMIRIKNVHESVWAIINREPKNRNTNHISKYAGHDDKLKKKKYLSVFITPCMNP